MKTTLFLIMVAAVLGPWTAGGQTPLSFGQPATASSYQVPNYPTNGNDGNLGTRWAAADATYPQWWRVDLGTSQTVTQAIVRWYSSSSRAYQYRIETSDDDANYSVLVDGTGNMTFGDTTNSFTAAARYVRVYVTGATSGWAGFFECQVFGDATPLGAPAPYAPDASTLFLFHFDEPAGGSAFTNTGAAGGNAYSVDMSYASSSPPLVTGASGAAGYPNFGNAANLNTPGYLVGHDANGSDSYDGETVDTVPMSSLNMGNGGRTPWTLEALIYPSVTNVNQEIISTDSSAGARGLQFRLNGAGQLELHLIDAGINPKTAIPASGDHAFAANNWYHVAATYDGTNIVLYWTKLSASLTAANPISTNAAVVDAAFGVVTGPLCIGNENRGAAGEYFRGLIDEVRISSVARAAGDMPAKSGLLWASPTQLSPANPAFPGTEVLLSSTVAGAQPISYFWLSDGGTGGATWTNLPGSATNAYALDTSGMPAGNYQYRLMVTNAAAAFTNAPATLNLVAAIIGSVSLAPPDDPLYAGTPVTLSAPVSGPAPVFFWQTDGGSGGVTWSGLPGSATNTYALDTTGMPPGTYQYRLVVTNSYGSITSAIVAMNVAAASGPVLVTDTTISPATANVGSSVLLSAAFTGNEPIRYQWFFGGSPVPGATNATHNLVNVQLSQAGNYHLLASNNPPGLGSRTAASTPAALTVLSVDLTAPCGLMVDLLAHPERTTVPDRLPEFTWIFRPGTRGENQSAYRIIVASSAAQAEAGNGDVWDSGEVVSGESVNVPFGAGALTRGATYYWRVRTWGTAGLASSWSDVQAFTIEASMPQTGARSIYRASANDATGYNWAGRYRSAFDTVVVPPLVLDKGGGNFFIDFGKDGFGYITVHLDGSYSGQTMTVRFGEKATGTSVNTSPGGSIIYTSRTVALQNGDVTYEIRTPDVSGGAIAVDSWAGGVVTPFRYVELLNCPGTVTADDIRQYVLHYPFGDQAASFVSSDAVLNAVWELCQYSIKATSFAAVYIDGDRERKPYEADAYINQLCHYGVDREYTMARYSYEYLLDHHTWPLEWRFHFPLMAWADYQYTGNAEALAANYNSISNYLRLDRERAADKLLQGWPNNGTSDPSDIIDWPVGERDGYVQTSYSSVINAFHYVDLRLMSRIALVLGKTVDAADFTARADQVQAAFNTVFWNTSSQAYQDGETSTHISAHGNFFPMAFGLVPSNRVAAVMSFLRTKRMAPSVYGAQYLLEALFEGGEADYAIGLMTDDDPAYLRHWWNMLAVGSTIALEAWDSAYKPNLDWNHAWGAAPGNIIPRYVLGLKPLSAGFGQVEIKPQLGQSLTFVRGIVPTIRGPVFIEATNASGALRVLVDLPGNVTATVKLPAQVAGSPVALVDGEVVSGIVSNGWLAVEGIGSGQHAIWFSATNQPGTPMLYSNWAAGWFGTNAGVPELASAAADPDTDGSSNYSEFVAGTDPMDSGSRFTIPLPALTNGPATVLFSIPGGTGRAYGLQRALNLMPSAWSNIVGTGILVSNQLVSLVDPEPPDTGAFYRLTVVRP